MATQTSQLNSYVGGTRCQISSGINLRLRSRSLTCRWRRGLIPIHGSGAAVWVSSITTQAMHPLVLSWRLWTIRSLSCAKWRCMASHASDAGRRNFAWRTSCRFLAASLPLTPAQRFGTKWSPSSCVFRIVTLALGQHSNGRPCPTTTSSSERPRVRPCGARCATHLEAGTTWAGVQRRVRARQRACTASRIRLLRRHDGRLDHWKWPGPGYYVDAISHELNAACVSAAHKLEQPNSKGQRTI